MATPTAQTNQTRPTLTVPGAPKPLAEPAPIVLSGVAPRPLFTTTTEDVPDVEAPKARKLNARTLAEHAAGVAAISQYAPAQD
jgi:hypothetical protein